MEIDNFHSGLGSSKRELNQEATPIQVRAIISCPKCEYKKAFRNQFYRKDIEMMVVSLKIFDWIVCDKCGDLLKLELEFQL